MFKNLFDLSYKRSLTESAGFYFAWVLFSLLATVVFIAILTPVSGLGTLSNDLMLGVCKTITVIVSATLAVFIVKKKESLKKPLVVISILCAVLLSALFGPIGGIIVPAYLTTEDWK